jgi:hypothetical protein
MSEMVLVTHVVLMPVPLQFAPQVAEYVSGLIEGRTDALHTRVPGDVSPDGVSVPGQGQWTAKMLGELADGMPYTGVATLFDRCAETPNSWVIKSDVEKHLGISPIQLRNELAALSKLTKRLFGRATWPIQWKKERSSYYYRMDDTLARWWRDCREGR